jgi:hypothetical protein
MKLAYSVFCLFASLTTCLAFAGTTRPEGEAAEINRWAQLFKIEITTNPSFGNNAENGEFGYSLPTATFQISNGLTCFYGEFSRNYIRSDRPDWYMSCGSDPCEYEWYKQKYPNCGKYDYSVYEKYVNCFRDSGTDNSKAVQCYRAVGQAGHWSKIKCVDRDD